VPRKLLGPEAEELLRAECARRWPDGIIPRDQGGAFFREISDRLGGPPEWKISDLARRLGLWRPKP
jgi:hypothetical protein